MAAGPWRTVTPGVNGLELWYCGRLRYVRLLRRRGTHLGLDGTRPAVSLCFQSLCYAKLTWLRCLRSLFLLFFFPLLFLFSFKVPTRNTSTPSCDDQVLRRWNKSNVTVSLDSQPFPFDSSVSFLPPQATVQICTPTVPVCFIRSFLFCIFISAKFFYYYEFYFLLVVVLCFWPEWWNRPRHRNKLVLFIRSYVVLPYCCCY